MNRLPAAVSRRAGGLARNVVRSPINALLSRTGSVSRHRAEAIAIRGLATQANVDANTSSSVSDAFKCLAALVLSGSVISASTSSVACDSDIDGRTGVPFSTEQVMSNWSGTHTSHPRRIYEPRTVAEVIRLLADYHDRNLKLRPVGTALSPNGVAMNGEHDLISCIHLDSISVDTTNNTVTVGAGATVREVLKALKAKGLTLQNFSSIQEQQMAGWTQVAAHGTGTTLPTVEEQVVQMKIVSPSEGLITLSSDINPKLFAMAKVGLGSLGVVTELTLKCVPRHDLIMESSYKTFDNISEGHIDRLRKYRHVRYMWIPFANSVISVLTHPYNADADSVKNKVSAAAHKKPAEPATTPLINLLIELQGHHDNKGLLEKMSFAQLRDLLLAFGPLELQHVKRINVVEAEYWRRVCSEPPVVGDSTDLLGFDCGGEQWVYEVCIPMGPLSSYENLPMRKATDLVFMEKLLKIIEDSGIPAPAPIEQRWTARSTAPMSPAYSASADDVFSWVGIIMYLPKEPKARKAVTEAFERYRQSMDFLVEEFNGRAHWAKLELPSPESPDYTAQLARMRRRVHKVYPVDSFHSYKAALDPNNVLSNTFVDALLSPPSEDEEL